MSAVFGFVDLKNELNEDEKKRIIDELVSKHEIYGDDQKGSIVSGNVIMGACINHIADDCSLPPPVLRKREKTAVIDALIYNRDELIKKLSHSGTFLDDKISDEELLFEFYIKFGEKSFAEINGDFAGAICDVGEKKLILFRDHLGVRPMFYAIGKNRIAFSTDNALLCSFTGFKLKLNEKKLYIELAGYSNLDAEGTFIENVFALLPAHTISFNTDRKNTDMQKSRYWKLGAQRIHFASEDEYIEKLRFLIKDAVHRRLAKTKRKVGSNISGGIDSTLISLLVNREGREAYYYSWSPDKKTMEKVKNDERTFIDGVCLRNGMSCNYTDFSRYTSGEDLFYRTIPKHIFSENSYTAECVLEDKAFALADVALIFSGWSGDEGVSHNASVVELRNYGERKEYFEEIKYRVNGNFIKLLKTMYWDMYVTVRQKIPFNLFKANKYPVKTFASKQFKHEFDSKVKKLPLFNNTAPLRQIEEGGNRARTEMQAQCGIWTGNKAQYVYPYLDYRVENYALSIPRHFFKKHGQGRYIYRKAFLDIFPEMKDRTKDDPLRFKFVETTFYRSYLETKFNYLSKQVDRNFWQKYVDFEAVQIMADNTDNLMFYKACETMALLHYLQSILEISGRQ